MNITRIELRQLAENAEEYCRRMKIIWKGDGQEKLAQDMVEQYAKAIEIKAAIEANDVIIITS